MIDELKVLGLAIVTAGALGLSLVACGGEEQAGRANDATREEAVTMASIEGEVFYRERIMLPPGAELEVQLEDISRADAMATVMATTRVPLEGGPPYAFTIEYQPADIDPRMRYALRARILRQDDLLFTNTEYIDPFSGDPIRIMVQAVQRPGRPVGQVNTATEHSDNTSPGGSGAVTWLLESLAGEPAPLGAGGKPAQLQLDQANQTVSGFSGCNRYSGGFNSEGNSTHGTPLKFGPMAVTRRYCADGDELERAYLKTLGTVDAYKMEGDRLSLLSDSEVVATFKPE